MPEAKEKEKRPQAFGPFLQKLHDGGFLNECGQDLQFAIQELYAADGKATAKLTLEIKLVKDAKSNAIDVIPSVSTKTPKRPVQRAVMFYDPRSGHIVPENPKQQSLPLREVGGGSTEFRDAAETG